MAGSQVAQGQALSAGQLRAVASIIAASFVLSGVLGLLRGAIIGAVFGAGAALDAFYAAYRLPEMLFTLVAGGALSSAFIPIFSRYLAQGDSARAWHLARATLSWVTLIALWLSLGAAMIAFPIADRLLMPHAQPPQKQLTAELMQIMLVTVAIFSASSLIMAILNANQRFLAPALAPSMNNVGLIGGALLLAPHMGVYGLAWGAVMGAALHLIVQLPALRPFWAHLRPSGALIAEGLGEIVRLMLPRLVGMAAVQLNFVVNIILASAMPEGSLAALSIAFTLMFVVLGIVAQSAGTAIFPTLSLYGARGDLERFRQTLRDALRGVLFVTLPATSGLIVLAQPLVSALLERGAWSRTDTVATAWALSFFAAGLVAFALQELLARAFYALRNTIAPVAVAVGGLFLNVALSLLLIQIVRGAEAGQGAHGGLALANALATGAESAALWLWLRRKIGALGGWDMLSMAGRALIATVGMSACVWAMSQLLARAAPLIVVMVCVPLGILLYQGLALLLGVPEARSLPMSILRRLKRG
ncbi:MAG: murein biosynthesis integral membrane protein MurJ [Chloroflexi bacterium]|nr:murein biosynthesis integral membrane protein MurJ [Chloroflexota bacterium]